MEPRPDVIVIAARHEEEVSADRAELLAVVQGSSLVTGRAALRKAKEVSKLVEELEKCGITSEDIGLEGVQAEVSSGILGRSSSATYRLRIRCVNLEALPDVLGAITSAKNARLEDIVWRYPESVEQQAGWLQACIAQANTKAIAAALALGTSIVGIHRLTERSLDEAVPRDPGDARDGRPSAAPARSRSSVQLGFELSHHKRTGAQVTIEYRVAGFKAAE
jgi:uncharacterized protein YggE